MRDPLDDAERELSGFVHPRKGEFEGEQFPHIFRLIEREEYNLTIEARHIILYG